MNSEFMNQLASLGEITVRQRLLTHYYGLPGSGLRAQVEEWLANQETSREIATQADSFASNREANALAREANASAREANALAREANLSASKANSLASLANRQALIALIISAITAITAIVVAIFQFSSSMHISLKHAYTRWMNVHSSSSLSPSRYDNMDEAREKAALERAQQSSTQSVSQP
jgi:hypothetical protein